ncbi:MAG: tetratricopeptide repeat protein [Myxococcota bacterium]|nr:tetratricopeptide repeat protein [Myxococcota bacterium]
MPSRPRPSTKPAPSSSARGSAKKPGAKARKTAGAASKVDAARTASHNRASPAATSRAVPGKKAPRRSSTGKGAREEAPGSASLKPTGRTGTPRTSTSLRPTAARDQARAPATSSGLTFPIEIDPERIEQTLQKIGEEVSHWAKKGRYTKVRFKFRGKQLLPDLPLAAVVAAEGLTFYWGGILRALLVTVGANAVFGVELVNDSEKKVLAGKEKLLRGDLEEALALFREAADMDRDNPHVHLNIGIALKLRGDRVGAREALLKARQLDPQGPTGDEAEKVLSTLPSQMTVTSVVQNGPPLNPDRPSGAV